MEIGTIDSWNIMFKILKTETDELEKDRLLKGLSGIKEPWTLRKYIEILWDDQDIPKKKYFKCLQYIVDNPFGTHLVWDYLRENWTEVLERFTPCNRGLEKTILKITSTFTTHIKLFEVNNFFNHYSEINIGIKELAISNIKFNIFWSESYSKFVKNLLEKL